MIPPPILSMLLLPEGSTGEMTSWRRLDFYRRVIISYTHQSLKTQYPFGGGGAAELHENRAVRPAVGAIPG